MTTATKNNTSAIPKAATKLVWIFDRSELMLLKRERGSRTGDLKQGNEVGGPNNYYKGSGIFILLNY